MPILALPLLLLFEVAVGTRSGEARVGRNVSSGTIHDRKRCHVLLVIAAIVEKGVGM